MNPWAARTGLALLLSAGTLPLCHGQDLLEVWQMAKARDPIYAAAGAGRLADQEVVPQARARLLPYITAGAAAEADEARRTRGLHRHRTDRRALWALTLTQPIIDVGAWNSLKQSEYIASSADVAQAGAYQDLILRVTQAYFDILAAQDTLRALMAEKSAIKTQLQAAQLGFELGGVTITDAQEAQARLDLINAQEILARNILQVTQDQLARIIAERPQQLAELAASTQLPAPEPNRLENWTTQSAQANLAVARAELATRIVEKQIDIAKSNHYPRLSLQAQTGSASDQGINADRSGPRSLNSSIGLQLSIPIYAGGEISSTVREQTSRLQQARYELEDARRVAVASTQRYFSGVTSGLARVEALQAAEKSSLAALQANQTGYELGVRVNIDVLNAQQQLYETQRNLALARYNTLMDSLRLKAASGILTDADIVAINQLLTHSGKP
ncbi:TolC family outer membrane protein [Pusillimonas sp. ANT_WB101]|uniref:TolC family outer membrane protein n=1 Tax=Pusillimonas sp. ANT_WB101 TaxID=2597356 RepID=UPI0011F0027B|nr:TolC family outer membrane protein [Pusillimonas sp. ANT_WB101]KAA0890683.1 TolC family outer membrane protein [Pusillimonas sp. ANT_WB101]